MKLFKVLLENLHGDTWIERIEGYDDRDVKDVVYRRYGLAVYVLATSL